MKKIILFLLVAVLVFIIACSTELNNPQFCQTGDDCICGGIDKVSKNCFVGNKNYYDSGAVDKSQYCPDFCTGIAGHLVTKCVENQCMNVNKNIFPECSADADCVPSSCCHASSCVPTSQAPNCEGTFCTQECAQGTLDCGGYCACESKRCVTKNLFDQGSGIPVV